MLTMRYLILLGAICISGCTESLSLKHMEIETRTEFLNKYVWIASKDSKGNIIQGTEKIVICEGYFKPFSKAMEGAVFIGSAALIGAGLGDSGDSSSTNINNRLNNNSSSVSSPVANAGASAGASSVSGASITQPRPHYYKELSPHEHGKYGVD